jgi:hypothetical protein
VCLSDLRHTSYEGVNAHDSSAEHFCDDDNATFVPIHELGQILYVASAVGTCYKQPYSEKTRNFIR